MTLSQRWHVIRTGFERPFWVANISELFERLSYFAAFASLARYLNASLQFPVEQASGIRRDIRRIRIGLIGRRRNTLCYGRPAAEPPRCRCPKSATERDNPAGGS